MRKNLINLYKHALEIIENPPGVDGQEKELIRNNGRKMKANLEKEFSKDKYSDDKEVQKLIKKDKKKKDKKNS